MRVYAARRVASAVVALLGVSVLAFALGVLAPGDPAEVVLSRSLGQPPTDEQLAEMRRELGTDRPVVVQYLDWLSGAVRGDFGSSWLRGVRVRDALAERVPRTFALAMAGAGLSLVIGIPIGVLAATRRNSVVDHVSRLGALVGASFPSFFLAYVLIWLLAVRFRALPVFGFGSAAHLVLPALTLALGPAAVLARLTRSAVLEVLGEGYIRTARSKGARGTAVLFHHALRNALIPVVTVAGLSVGHLLGGSLIVEWVFAWPGMGELAVSAIHDRDYPLVQGFVLFAAAVYLLVNLLVDLSYARLDPRVRVEGRRS
ncbi:MAG TPA: nickel ABC transporter permease [Acidimicrobiales bacterium]|nr:nickel ABC transporter permease [Acidimicrobiales bacterium]